MFQTRHSQHLVQSRRSQRLPSLPSHESFGTASIRTSHSHSTAGDNGRKMRATDTRQSTCASKTHHYRTFSSPTSWLHGEYLEAKDLSITIDIKNMAEATTRAEPLATAAYNLLHHITTLVGNYIPFRRNSYARAQDVAVTTLKNARDITLFVEKMRHCSTIRGPWFETSWRP